MINFDRDERFPGLEDGYYCFCAELLEIYFCIGNGDVEANAIFFCSFPKVRSRDEGPSIPEIFNSGFIDV